MKRLQAVIVGAAMLAMGSSAMAASVFSDDFNRNALNPDTSNPLWVGKDGTASSTSGKIVDNALVFTTAASAGDAFSSLSKAFTATAGQWYELTFDYKGVAGSPLSGGYIGMSEGTPGNHNWLAGTGPASLGGSLALVVLPSSTAARTLVSDGDWHSYSILFKSNSNKNLRVMVEDFVAPGENAYFDNITVTAVPLPAAVWGGLTLMGGIVASRLRRRA